MTHNKGLKITKSYWITRVLRKLTFRIEQSDWGIPLQYNIVVRQICALEK